MRATASISQSALAHNLQLVKCLAPQSKIVAMIKANAYGHRIDLVKPLLDNADILAVSELKEAEKLRTISQKPLLLLSGIFSNDELENAVKLNCIVVIHHISQLSIIANTKHTIAIWLKIDTGMHRLGLSNADYQKALTIIDNHPNINVDCVMSHFACSDKINHPLNAKQLKEFNQLNISIVKRSMANSGAIMSNDNALFDYVRPGIMLYGISPFATPNAQLKPVMTLSAPIMSIKVIDAGESVGYGATWTAKKSTKIAIIGIGYGDGYPRHAKNGTPVLINNHLCTLVGRVSMDMICVDISNIEAQIGDLAILWGDKQLAIETVADYAGTIGYELATGVSSRVNFISSE